jgi:hypothetical protein
MDDQSVTGQSNSSKVTYVPYTVKDYKENQVKTQGRKLGGLGANIGSEEWEKAQKKKLDAKLFSEKVRLGV